MISQVFACENSKNHGREGHVLLVTHVVDDGVEALGLVVDELPVEGRVQGLALELLEVLRPLPHCEVEVIGHPHIIQIVIVARLVSVGLVVANEKILRKCKQRPRGRKKSYKGIAYCFFWSAVQGTLSSASIWLTLHQWSIEAPN